MKKLGLFLILVFICFNCRQKIHKELAKNENVPISNMEVAKRDCDSIDENKIFNDTTWFLPYADADSRDPLREVYEEWKVHIDEECDITLTLYKDSTYRDSSPCEWDFSFTGFYKYVCDTLYCVKIDINNHSISHYNPPKVICLEKYIKQNNCLTYIERKEKRFEDKFYVQKAPNKLCFELVKCSY